MTMVHLLLTLAIAGGPILGCGIVKGALARRLDRRADAHLGPGDIDAARYLASGRVAWANRRVRKTNAVRSNAGRRNESRFTRA